MRVLRRRPSCLLHNAGRDRESASLASSNWFELGRHTYAFALLVSTVQ
jgi:hypothetical protein